MATADPKTDAPDMAALARTGTVTLGNVAVTLTRRGASRIVIGFFESDAEAAWLDEVCEAEAFSEVRFFGPPRDLASDEVAGFVERLATSPVVAGYDVSLCGARGGCRPAFAATGHFRAPVLVAIDPTVDALPPDATGYLFYDPFATDLRPAPGNQLEWLKCVATNGDSARSIARMRLARAVFPAALRGELDPTLFYSRMRARKDYRFYRQNIEAALAARGREDRAKRFRLLFRQRRQAAETDTKFQRLRDRAEAQRPTSPGSWARLRTNGEAPVRPSAGGNIWMLQHDADGMRYMSDRWGGATIGYVERDGVTLAETPDLALCFLGFGDGFQVQRPLAQHFPWHVTDTRLDGTVPAMGMIAEATLASERAYGARETLHSTLTVTQTQPGITAQEALPGSPAYDALLSQLDAGQSALAVWNKRLVVDRIRLALLTGAPTTSEAEAAKHYFDVAQALTTDVLARTGQNTPPVLVVIPQAGSRTDGTSEVALAESRFDLDNPVLNAIVPTPAYPWPLMAGTPATPSPEAALLMDELSCLAVAEHQAGRRWFCPSLQLARLKGRTIHVTVSTMGGLELDDGPHGFHVLSGIAPLPIARVQVVSDTEITVELDSAPTDELRLTYAWGHKNAAASASHSANHGALHDGWHADSQSLPGQKLRRYALPARLPVRSEQR